MYRYYQEVEDSKHYPFAREVARLLKKRYSIVSLSGLEHTSMVKACLDYIEKSAAENTGEAERKLYYPTRNGLLRVYPNWGEVELFIALHTHEEKNGMYKAVFEGKAYNYKKLKEEK